MSALAKLLSLIISTVVGLVAALVLVSYFLISGFEEANVQSLLNANQKTVQKELDTSMRNSLLAGTLMAANPDFARAVLYNDTKMIQAFARRLLTNRRLIS